MTTEKLHAVHTAKPFKAFRLQIADGRQLKVKHPESLAYIPGGRTAVLVHPDETHEIIDLLMVTTIEVVNGTASRSARRN